MPKQTTLTHIDWAMKYILHKRENFDVLEGFLSALLEEDIHIETTLNPESIKERKDDKFNRVDVLTQNSKGEYIIIEVQNANESDYFKRILWGVSKLVTQSIHEGDPYEKVQKVVSVTIAYFDLGVGNDYVYHGTTRFVGTHNGIELKLSDAQKDVLKETHLHKVYSEYYILKVQEFNEKDTPVLSELDEWIYLFKYSEMKPGSTARGIQAANEKLSLLKMSPEERDEYEYHIKRLRDEHSATLTPDKYYMARAERTILENKDTWLEEGRTEGVEQGRSEGEKIGMEKGRTEGVEQGRSEGEKIGMEKGRAEGVEQGRAEGMEKGKTEQAEHIARTMLANNEPTERIMQYTGLSAQEIERLR